MRRWRWYLYTLEVVQYTEDLQYICKDGGWLNTGETIKKGTANNSGKKYERPAAPSVDDTDAQYWKLTPASILQDASTPRFGSLIWIGLRFITTVIVINVWLSENVRLSKVHN